MWTIGNYLIIVEKDRQKSGLLAIPSETRKIIVFSNSTFKQYPFLQNQPNVMLIETEQEAMDLDCQE